MSCPTVALGAITRTRTACKFWWQASLLNQYGVILVNPDKHPNVQKEFGQAFIDWLVSPDGQKAIANYKINDEQLFFPNADDPKS
jgi:tungstate transport system substrate-binding protein